MTGLHQAVHQRFVFRSESLLQRAEVFGPLFHGAWTGDNGVNRFIVEHPVHRELHGGHAAFLRLGFDLLRQLHRLFAEFRLHDALIATSGSAFGPGRCPSLILTGEYATRHRAVRDDADAEVRAGWQYFDFRQTIHRVVIGLTDHRRRYTELFAGLHHQRNAPAAKVADTEVADLASANQVAEGADRFMQGRAGKVQMRIVDIDIVRGEPRQACLAGPHDPAPAQAAVVGIGAHGIADLGSEDPTTALVRDQLSRHTFRFAVDVGVRCVDEIDSGVMAGIDDTLRFVDVGPIAKQHGSNAKG